MEILRIQKGVSNVLAELRIELGKWLRTEKRTSSEFSVTNLEAGIITLSGNENNITLGNYILLRVEICKKG